MNKCHTPINWVNDQTPALNDTNLNYMDGCIDTIDDRVVAIANDPPENALKAEGWAIGEQGGVPVTSGSPYYENNSKYYSEQSAAENLVAEGYANGTQNGTPVTSGSPYYENNAKYWKEQAQQIAAQQLGALSDVTINNAQNGDVLTYNSSTSEWENQASSASGKADKVSGATSGNFAGLDANGNLTDSGKKTADFAAASHNHAPSDINSAGTLGARVQANGTAAATLGNAQVRDIYAGTSDMTAGTTALTTGTIYIVYE
jgi:hypothetical protein